MQPTVEHQRLQDHLDRKANWKKWGPYVSERAWGTVREDYSADGSAWEYFPHDHARSRAEELGEPFSRELSLYLIHGWLHLAGYDDRAEADRAKMREAEQLALSLIDAQIEPIEFRLS